MGPVPEKAKPEPWKSTEIIMQHLLMVESYRRLVGSPLLDEVEIEEMAQALWEAPFALLAHNRGSHAEGADVVFTFANKLALAAFDAEWDELIGRPSAISVADDLAEGREALMADTEASDAGFTRNYSGERRSLKGRTFQICDATLWNINSPTGKMVGQACWFDTVKEADGTVVKLGQPATSAVTPADIGPQEAAVAQQAEVVRELKAQGLTNKSPEVLAAVEELLARKTALEAMTAQLAAGDPEAPEP